MLTMTQHTPDPCPPLDVRVNTDELLARSPHCSTSSPDELMSIIPWPVGQIDTPLLPHISPLLDLPQLQLNNQLLNVCLFK